jgi:hypothetical protein
LTPGDLVVLGTPFLGISGFPGQGLTSTAILGPALPRRAVWGCRPGVPTASTTPRPGSRQW